MNKKIFFYIALGILILVLLVFTLFPNMIYAVKSIGNTGNVINYDSGDQDICSPPAGTSEEEWKTHMGHHPNIYAECLN